MSLNNRIDSFIQLGKFLRNPENQEEIETWADNAVHTNNWFTPENTRQSLKALAEIYLDEKHLNTWAGLYEIPDRQMQVKSIGVIMAGNIPAVGFHDLLTIVISGHACVAKVSSQDNVLMTALINKLLEINPSLDIRISEQMKEIDALIATGSDNTSRYFEYYFRNKPHIIRKNRSSIAILNGQENTEELNSLGKDITAYYGLGCRNVSKMYVPKGYKFDHFYQSIESLSEVIQHNKFQNNYDYNRSIYLVNGVPHFDNGFLMITENEALVSPISVLFYETYENAEELNTKIDENLEKIQCMVSQNAWFKNSLPFGQSQSPKLWDYADGVDTMQFLLELK